MPRRPRPGRGARGGGARRPASARSTRPGAGASGAGADPRPRRILDATGDSSSLRTAMLGLGGVAVALGLVVAGVVVVTRGGGSTAQACTADAQGWNGAGAGASHTGSRAGAGTDHGATWKPDWQTPAAGATADLLTAPPAVAGGTVFTGDAAGRLVALDAGTGQRRWTSDPGQGEAGAVRLTPALDGCTAVVVTAPAGGGGVLRGVDLTDHGRRFGTRSDDRIVSAPEIVNGVAFAGVAAGSGATPERRVDGVALLDGTRRLQQPVGAGVEASVAADGDHVYAADSAGMVYGLSIDSNGSTLHQMWSVTAGGPVTAGPLITADQVVVATAAGHVVALDPATGRERWHAEAAGAVTVMPVAVGDVLVVASHTGGVTALGLAAGAVRWHVEVGAGVSGLAAVADTVEVAGGDGVLRALSLTEAGRERSSWRAGAPLVGGPAIAGGRVVVTSADGRVSALPL